MGDRRLVALAPAPGHVLVQVGEASGHGLRHVTQLAPRDDVPLEVIREGALRRQRRLCRRAGPRPAPQGHTRGPGG